MNPLVELQAYGQSFWYDNIQRRFLNDGTLQALIEKDGLRGMTSNPSIFDKAIGKSEDYDRQISQEVQAGKDVQQVYEALARGFRDRTTALLSGRFLSSPGLACN